MGRLCFPGLSLVFLGLVAAPGQKLQQNGIAIWELPRPKMNAMLTAIPRNDAARYDRLRQDFIGFGCTGASLEEQAIDKKGRHRNLLCTLPGQEKQPILVSAWYPEHRTWSSGNSRGWPDAVVLPLLYHALSAEPHHFTFVFAAFDGRDGESHYFRERGTTDPPLVVVALQSLALSPPHFYAELPQSVPAKLRPAEQAVLSTAWEVARLQALNPQTTWFPLDSFPGNAVSAKPPAADPKDVPRILIFSTYSSSVSLDAFVQDHDFIAFILAGLDMRFSAPLLPPAGAPPKSAAAPAADSKYSSHGS